MSRRRPRAWWLLLGALVAMPMTARAQQRSAARVGAELALVNAAGALVLAGVDHLQDSPEVWTRDGTGFGQRLGVRAVQFGASAVAEVGLAAWRREGLGYEPCRCQGGVARVGHAALAGLTVTREDGSRGFAWPIAIGAVIGGAASAPLLPASERWTWTLTRPLTTLALRMVLNVVREAAR